MNNPSDRITNMLGKRAAKRAAAEQEKQDKREAMRLAMPEVASVVDDLRNVFGDGVTVLAASEGGKVVKAERRLRMLGVSDEWQ